jgi:hypothetical protein
MEERKTRRVRAKNRGFVTKETVLAISFVIGQITRGWTPVEAFQQTRNSYGSLIAECVEYYLARSIQKI